MVEAGHDDAAVVARSAAAIVSRLDQRLAEVTASIQQTLVTEIAELRGDAHCCSCCVTASTETSPQYCPPSATPSRSKMSSYRRRPSNTHGASRSVE